MITTPDVVAADSRPDPAKATTRALLACGVAAGPVYVVVVAIQAFAREGFDITRQPASLLSTGDRAGSRSSPSW